MAIFKVAERKHYVNVNMDILTSKDLTAMEKVVLIFALSRPDNWKFTIRGIAYFMHEGCDAVRTALLGLEKKGYIARRRIRDKGKIVTMEYNIFEIPRPPKQETPEEETPELVPPNMAGPLSVSTEAPNTDVPNIDNHIIGISTTPSIYPQLVEDIQKQIQYAIMCEAFDKRILDDIVSVMTEVMVSQSTTIIVSRDKAFPTDYVRDCLSKINPLHIEQILRSMERDQPVIRNVRGYLLTALINTTNTMDTGYEYGEL